MFNVKKISISVSPPEIVTNMSHVIITLSHLHNHNNYYDDHHDDHGKREIGMGTIFYNVFYSLLNVYLDNTHSLRTRIMKNGHHHNQHLETLRPARLELVEIFTITSTSHLP